MIYSSFAYADKLSAAEHKIKPYFNSGPQIVKFSENVNIFFLFFHVLMNSKMYR